MLRKGFGREYSEVELEPPVEDCSVRELKQISVHRRNAFQRAQKMVSQAVNEVQMDKDYERAKNGILIKMLSDCH